MESALHQMTTTQMLELSNTTTITVKTYARALLNRVSENEDIVKAWSTMATNLSNYSPDPGLVIAQAQTLDQVPADQRGPLHGLAIRTKNIMDTKDIPTEYGSPIYRGHQPSSDSAAVANLRASGALIIGKTTTTRTPGGSSCGSAAVVASMHVPLSLGSQTGGSLMRPASFTGVHALKPTIDAISMEGQKIIAPTFDTIGFFARCVEDLQLLADVFGLKDDEPARDMPLEEISIALVKTPIWPAAEPGTISAMEKAATILRDKIIKVEEDNLAPEIRDIVENTSEIEHGERKKASNMYSHMRHVFNNLAREYTAILTPSAVDEAPVGHGNMGCATFNTIWTGFHMPGINVPVFVGANSMPVGMSLVGPRLRDQQLLKTTRVLVEVFGAQGSCKIPL
ncbi:glutamyl-tRNA amidotransferase subunit A [Colletotrichum godetiae]|uniref:Glutamyl-tRNA amidotransferase subunit A n=1 Tax=Colletotrichum godetiae TaxID=1209918 RepID=A0AAJ0A6J2_9PEZI|nr:glutamyl-tRNA amidotransferase subunit A [Colletotrichum godetiae]KAK1656813.1 glutamyl-tRNA amidotransferase subunit A [Colletotrichum godetiae]